MKDLDKVIERILVGETELFRLLVDCYHHKVFVLIRGFVHQEQDAEDLTQETFINAFVSLGSFKGKAEFSTWLYRIAVNTTYSFLRKSQREKMSPFLASENGKENEKEKGKSPYQQTSERQINEFIYKEIDRLPNNQRIAFVLSRVDGMSQKEIAKVMGVSVSAVDSLVQRAKRKLKEKLKFLIDEK